MKIKIIKKIPLALVKEQLKKVSILGRPEVLVYKRSRISLHEYDPSEINVEQFYVLKENIEFQKKLRRNFLRQYDLDTLNLTDGIIFSIDGGSIKTLIPPIIEIVMREVIYKAEKGEKKYAGSVRLAIPCLRDGMHRVALARELKTTFTGILISSVDYPHHVLPNYWDKVTTVKKLPTIKKLYVRKDGHNYYRNFNILGNIGQPRQSKAK
jgi:hypothetical protein